MSNVVTDSMRDPGTLTTSSSGATAREPITDPTLGIAVAAAGADAAVPPNRLVTIGGSAPPCTCSRRCPGARSR